MKRYAYFFTRQDISPEQQIVQTAHAALKLGYKLVVGDEMYKTSNPEDPDNTYFTVVGVRNEEALGAVLLLLNKFDIAYEAFFEPDMDDQVTSIAVYPMNEDTRGVLLAFNLLKV